MKLSLFEIGLLFVASLGAVGCGSGPKTQHNATPAACPQPAAEPVIVRIVGREQTITVTAGPSSALYSARTPEGKPIVTNATLEELRTAHPAVYRQVVPSLVTSDASAHRPMLDASNDLR